MTDEERATQIWRDIRMTVHPERDVIAPALAAVRAEATLAMREACAKAAYDEVASWKVRDAPPGIVAAAIRAMPAPAREPTTGESYICPNCGQNANDQLGCYCF